MDVQQGLSLYGKTIVFRNRDEMAGEWRKLHKVQLHNFFSPKNIRGI
jgi:hypothetical protein